MSVVSALVAHQFKVFALALGCGAALAAAYDVIRIFRRIIRHGIVLLSLEDVLYWIGFAAAEFVLLYQVESGMMRIYVFVGSALGAAAYRILPGRYLVRAASALIRRIRGFCLED
ncbi:MAG: spore cortex biosynthesis protein YabQ [Clostridiales bacterium]|nr:spore cortex biosynthesis protein YabQ [Clostridiales bacterium]